MRFNRASDPGEFGLYVGDSPNANATVVGNTSRGSLGGIFLRNVRNVEAAYNTFTANCIGMLPEGGPNGSGLNIHHNTVRGNNRVCPGEGSEPDVGGVGIAVVGIQNSTFRANLIVDNHAASPFSGGLVLLPFGRPITGNLFERNVMFRNTLDVRLSPGITGNVFRSNSCATSIPARICR